MRHKDGKKILGLVGIIVTTTISTIVTQWLADREIEEKVKEAITEKES